MHNTSSCSYQSICLIEVQQVKQNLSQDLLKLLELFHENCMILNPEKCLGNVPWKRFCK